MKKRNLLGLTLAGAIAATTYAQAHNVIRMQAPIAQGNFWEQTQDFVSAWAPAGQIYGCSVWTPEVNTVESGHSFTQSASDCLQTKERTIQPQEIHSKTHAVRNAGQASTESTVRTVSSTRAAIGTLIIWQQGYSKVGEWVNATDPAASSSCSWTPAVTAVDKGVSFTQTGSTCYYTQIQTVQPQERNPVTGEMRDTGTAYTRNRQMVTTATRTAVGTKAPVVIPGLPANEGGTFTITSPATVYYGVKGTTRLTSKIFAAGQYSCSNGVFGDPASGTVKTCWAN